MTKRICSKYMVMYLGLILYLPITLAAETGTDSASESADVVLTIVDYVNIIIIPSEMENGKIKLEVNATNIKNGIYGVDQDPKSKGIGLFVESTVDPFVYLRVKKSLTLYLNGDPNSSDTQKVIASLDLTSSTITPEDDPVMLGYKRAEVPPGQYSNREYELLVTYKPPTIGNTIIWDLSKLKPGVYWSEITISIGY